MNNDGVGSAAYGGGATWCMLSRCFCVLSLSSASKFDVKLFLLLLSAPSVPALAEVTVAPASAPVGAGSRAAPLCCCSAFFVSCKSSNISCRLLPVYTSRSGRFAKSRDRTLRRCRVYLSDLGIIIVLGDCLSFVVHSRRMCSIKSIHSFHCFSRSTRVDRTCPIYDCIVCNCHPGSSKLSRDPRLRKTVIHRFTRLLPSSVVMWASISQPVATCRDRHFLQSSLYRVGRDSYVGDILSASMLRCLHIGNFRPPRANFIRDGVKHC